MEKQLPEAAATAMLQASLLSREGRGRDADAALAALAARGDAGKAADASLMRAQLAAASGDGAAALQHLGALQDAAWQARPAVLATKVALLEGLGQPAQAAATLSSALEHWRAGEAGAGARVGRARAAWGPQPHWPCPLLTAALPRLPGPPPSSPTAADSPLRGEALRWICTRLAAAQLAQGELAQAAAQYRQLVELEPAALEGARVFL